MVLSQQPLEKLRESEKIIPKPLTKQSLKDMRRLFRELKSSIKKLEQTTDNIIMKEFTKEDKGYD